MQSKKDSHKEVITNQIIGILIGWFLVFLFDDILSDSSAIKATQFSCIFFISSYTRAYVIRRFFNK